MSLVCLCLPVMEFWPVQRVPAFPIVTTGNEHQLPMTQKGKNYKKNWVDGQMHAKHISTELQD